MLFDIALIIIALANIYFLQRRYKRQDQEIAELWETMAKMTEIDRDIIKKTNTHGEHLEKIIQVLIEKNFIYGVAKKQKDES